MSILPKALYDEIRCKCVNGLVTVSPEVAHMSEQELIDKIVASIRVSIRK